MLRGFYSDIGTYGVIIDLVLHRSRLNLKVVHESFGL